MEKNGMHSHAEHGNEKSQSIDNDGKPLLTVEYMTSKVIWRLFYPNILGLILSAYLVNTFYNKVMQEGSSIESSYVLAIFIFLFIGGLLATIEMLLIKEIRFYQDRIEKEWAIFGIRSLQYSNMKIRGISTWLASTKSFLYINPPKWYKYKCCGYDEYLISNKEKEKAIEILANISNRDIEEFNESRLEINPLIKYKG